MVRKIIRDICLLIFQFFTVFVIFIFKRGRITFVVIWESIVGRCYRLFHSIVWPVLLWWCIFAKVLRLYWFVSPDIILIWFIIGMRRHLWWLFTISIIYRYFGLSTGLLPIILFIFTWLKLFRRLIAVCFLFVDPLRMMSSRKFLLLLLSILLWSGIAWQCFGIDLGINCYRVNLYRNHTSLFMAILLNNISGIFIRNCNHGLPHSCLLFVIDAWCSHLRILDFRWVFLSLVSVLLGFLRMMMGLTITIISPIICTILMTLMMLHWFPFHICITYILFKKNSLIL